jgi:hypothetical protein
LATSHSAPLYLEGNESAEVTAGAPRLVEQPPKEAEEGKTYCIFIYKLIFCSIVFQQQ